MVTAFPFLTNVKLTLKTVTVPLASRDTISRKDNASSLTSTMPSLLTLDAQYGIGTTKFVSNVLKVGSSMLRMSVSHPQIYVKLLILKLETVLLVMRAMTSRKDNVFILTSIMLVLMILGVQLGIGKIRFA